MYAVFEKIQIGKLNYLQFRQITQLYYFLFCESLCLNRARVFLEKKAQSTISTEFALYSFCVLGIRHTSKSPCESEMERERKTK